MATRQDYYFFPLLVEIRQRNRTHEYKHRQLCDRYTYIHINILYRSTDWIQHLFYTVGAGVGLFLNWLWFSGNASSQTQVSK